MRRSRTEPDQGPHVRPGRRPIRRAASTAASSNRAPQTPVCRPEGRGVEIARQHAPAAGGGVEVGEHVAQLAAPISEPLSHGVDVGGGQVEVQNLDGLVVVGSWELGHERRAIGKPERPHAPRRPERDSHAVVIPRGLELAERQHAAEHLGLRGRQLLDDHHVGLHRLDQVSERVGVSPAVGEIRGKDPESETPHVAVGPDTTGGTRSAHGAADS